jgi:hypothetical protein
VAKTNMIPLITGKHETIQDDKPSEVEGGDIPP